MTYQTASRSSLLLKNSVRFWPKGLLDPVATARGSDTMKIALKYGLAVALIIAAWVALKHFVLHMEGSSAQFADIAVFNLSAIVALMMGIKEKRLANGDRLTFMQGLGTGVSIALTYAILTSLYFALLLKLVGPRLMQQEGETNVKAAFLGLGIGLMLFGTIFSALIALVLKKT
jgi:uncharacterized protein DUF4199